MNEPGWMADPRNPAVWRYWNGRKFTGYTAPPGGPFPPIPEEHVMASPTMWERFQQRSGRERIAIGAALIVVAGGLLVAGQLAGDNESDSRPDSAQSPHAPDGGLGGAAVSQVYRLNVDVELVQACADYSNGREEFLQRVLDAAEPVGADRIMPNRNDETAWHRIACT